MLSIITYFVYDLRFPLFYLKSVTSYETVLHVYKLQNLLISSILKLQRNKGLLRFYEEQKCRSINKEASPSLLVGRIRKNSSASKLPTSATLLVDNEKLERDSKSLWKINFPKKVCKNIIIPEDLRLAPYCALLLIVPK